MIAPSYGLTSTERVLPRLALDFTTASLDSRITFTRALNTATVVNSSGYVTPIDADLPRFEYNPVTLACKGLLIEESRKNIFLNSANLTTASWIPASTILSATASTSPANTNTANSVTPNNGTGAGNAQIYQTQTCSASTAYTYSIYLKANGMTTYQLRLIIRQSGGAYIGEADVNVDLSAVSVTTTTAGTPPTSVSATITAAGNSWYRVTLTGTTTSLTGLIRCGLYNLTTGNGTNGVLAWGVQVEAGAFATSYIPTDATAGGITRNADVATMTSTNFSDWYSAGAGGVVVGVLPSTTSGTRPALQFDDATANEIIALRGNTTNPELVIVDGGAPQAQINAGTIAANTAYNLGATWGTDNCAAAVNGGAAVTDNTATIPTVTQARLGSDGTNYANAWLQKILYWPQRLINSEVEAFSK
jgi:hypothetical protein